jgi:MFS family permease
MAAKTEPMQAIVDDAPLVAVAVEDDIDDAHRKCLVCRPSVFMLSMIVLLNVFLFADQNLLAPVLTPIARDFGWVIEIDGEVQYKEENRSYGVVNVTMVDTAKADLYISGYISLGFWVIGGFAAIVMGVLTDTGNRRNLLALVAGLGAASSLVTYFASSTFWGLFACRVLTGIAIGGSAPLLYSLLGDLFSVHARGKAIALSGAAIALGPVAGQVASGILAGEDGTNWRMAFLVTSIPALIMTGVFLATVQEPKRGRMEAALGGQVVSGESISCSSFAALLKTRTILLVFLQGIPASLPWGVLLGVFSDFLIETKDVPRDLSGLVVTAFAGGALLGAIGGGFVADRLVNKMRFLPIIMGSTTAVGAIPMVFLVQLPPLGVVLYCALAFPSGIIIGVTGSVVKVVLLNVTTPFNRGSAFAVFTLFDDLGKGAGTFAVSALSASLQKALNDNEKGRTLALTIAMFGWVLGAGVHFLMFFYIEKDYAAAQATMAALADKSGAPVTMTPVTKEDV